MSSTVDVPIVSMQRGGKSKDTWVLADGPVSTVTLLAPSDPIRLEPATTELPSRVAENLFWLGRYVERAEHIVRLLRSFVSRLADQDTTDNPQQVAALAAVLVGLRLLPEELGRDTWLRKLEEDTSDLIARQAPHSGLRSVLNEVRRLASAVRDRLSIDTWRILNQLHQDMRVRQGRVQFEVVLAHLNRIVTDLAAFSGMEMENMTRGHGWRFLNLGRRLERSVNLVGVLRGALAGRQRHRRAAARNRGQLHDVSSTLLRAAAAAAGPAPAACRRYQHARTAVSAGRHRGAHRSSAAGPTGAVANERGPADCERPGHAVGDHRVTVMDRRRRGIARSRCSNRSRTTSRQCPTR